MKTYITHTTGILNRWTRFLGAMLTVALMVPAVVFSQPSAPVLDSPVDAAVDVSTSPTLSWIAAAGDSVYHLQIDTNIVFGTTLYNDSTLTGVSHIITGLRNATQYYWHVSVKANAENGGGTSAYSTIRSFTTWNSTPTTPLLPVTLGLTDGFAILSYAGIMDAGASSITGDVGVSPLPASSMTGFDASNVVGTIYGVDATGPTGSVVFPSMLTQAMIDLTTAFDDAAGRTVNPIGVSGNLGGQTLYSGLYKSTGSLEITSGDLTLDAQGDVDAVWIFQIASFFNMTDGRQVFLSGDAQASNIFWQVGSGATFGTTCVMKGTIMAYANITFATGASLEGRALARTESVTLESNIVTRPATVVITPPIVSFTDPADAAIGVALNQEIVANFSKTMDASTITALTFTLMQGTTSVSGFVSCSGTIAIFAPSSNLVSNTLYTVTITTGAMDLAGIALASNYVWSFTTGEAETAVENIGIAPQEFALLQNYPNPFNPSTRIQYSLEKAGMVSLKVYNVLGLEVATLVNGRQEAGSYTVPFSASGGGTSTFASGVYFYRLEAGSFVSTKKLILMK